MRRLLRHSYRTARKMVVGVIGGTVVMIGVALVVLPGPAVVVVPLGLGILSLEFAWARRWLKELRRRSGNLVEQVRGRAVQRTGR